MSFGIRGNKSPYESQQAEATPTSAEPNQYRSDREIFQRLSPAAREGAVFANYRRLNAAREEVERRKRNAAMYQEVLDEEHVRLLKQEQKQGQGQPGPQQRVAPEEA